MQTSIKSWASNMPIKQGLYDPELEKDACGVGFIVQIKGLSSHKIVSDAKQILCNMTHRGASGADMRDGDGAGVMTSIPHEFFVQESTILGYKLPNKGEYAVGNLFFNPQLHEQHKLQFESIAVNLGLVVMFWRQVPIDNTILGPSSKTKEPLILQPIVRLKQSEFNEILFKKQLFLLRKISNREIGLKNWFYICSLCTKNIVYKGLLTTWQVYDYFLDLGNANYKSHFALVHSRFSTNTFPSWNRAQPLRYCAHNGEINTLRGNKNWMRSREGVIKSELFGSELEDLFPIIEEDGSDSSAFDNVLELLLMNGVLSLPEVMMMMVPEAWQNNTGMSPDKRAFYEWASCLMEPWDGPALFTFSDGRFCGACLDRNGLRPCRYYITNDDRMICASEVGTIFIEPEIVLRKGRLQPGRMLLVDTQAGHIIDDRILKENVARNYKFSEWVNENKIDLKKIVLSDNSPFVIIPEIDDARLDPRFKAFGFNLEQLNLLLLPMLKDGKEALGSMGNDSPLACLSNQPRSIFEYFRQLFAQVTNPPIDPIREEIVMSLQCSVGPMGNILEMNPSQCRRLNLDSPILTLHEMEVIKRLDKYVSDWSVFIIDIVFDKSNGFNAYSMAIDRICAESLKAINLGYKVIILSDKKVSANKVPLSSLIAVGAVHQCLVRNKQRSKVALFVQTGEAREVHHHCVLLGYGADGICPYLVFESMAQLFNQKIVNMPLEKMIENYIKATNNGILKVMSKMGISTLQSYKGAQIFEALGIGQDIMNKCFLGTASRIKGIDFYNLAEDAFKLHELAYPTRSSVTVTGIPEPGDYHWRKGGENHLNEPETVANLQDAVKNKNIKAYQKYSKESQKSIENCTLRGLLDFNFNNARPIPVEEVEDWTQIVKRFCTGAMSYGSISFESHSALAIAMNTLGGKSNTGEGGEDPTRSETSVNGVSLRSSIKQVASGRFGVTSYYLSDADELQIKMAQGAKPGEGGELPGHKVSGDIAKTRKSTPGVGLISPPPHHDIYSIEDLKQLIYDLKTANPSSRISVKLVSEVGVGIVASGVAKAKADHILISGHDGGTGASRWTGIKYAGLPWELGLAETHQTLVLNGLRDRVVIQTDGQIKTGRDVAIACLLGAEEWGFATTPLIALGCIMMRKCHLNTCPVGIATQDPILRKKFDGQPEYVINFFYYIAEEMREIMAKLGFRSINEMVGRSDFLKISSSLSPKANKIDLSAMLVPAYKLRPGVDTYCTKKQDHKLHTRLDNKLISESQISFNSGKEVFININITNIDRAFGSTLSYNISKMFGENGLKDGTINIKANGSAGQSFGAFLAKGVKIELEGDANDYVGKGLSGGIIIIYPPKASKFKSEESIIVGNVCLYGATSGQAYFRGIAAERFAVRNSGAVSVVEGVGDHGCEYMTGGRVIILGHVGRNFAAGMSGGIAYILDSHIEFDKKCNLEMVSLETVNNNENDEEYIFLRETIMNHFKYTGSYIADQVLKNFPYYVTKFIKVMPIDYKNALLKLLSAPSDIKIEHSAETPDLVTDIEDVTTDEELLESKLKILDKTKGFIKYNRKIDPYRETSERIKDWEEISNRMPKNELKAQTARCMDCGIPFCQSNFGCPIGNIIPKFNDMVFKSQWKDAFNRLMMTNNFPEFTGRVCPAPCEGACVLGINADPVSIKSIECAIIDYAFDKGWVVPNIPKTRTDKKVAIVGSGPAGLSAADQLNKAGHLVTVFERQDKIGGLLIYGIPNMKLDKKIVQRRVDLLASEGIIFKCNVEVGKDVDFEFLESQFDSILVCTGSTIPRDLNIKNRNLEGIQFAMELLTYNTKNLIDTNLNLNPEHMYLNGKDVVVIGGGDTGNDCIGTAVRHGANSVVNFELLPQPPNTRDNIDNPWPQYPKIFRVDYGHTEVKIKNNSDPREYSILTKEFVPSEQDPNHIAGLKTVRVEWFKDPQTGNWAMKEVPNSEQFFKCDYVFLALGFIGPEQYLLKEAGISITNRGNVDANEGLYRSSRKMVYAAGDCRRGQSLIVWAINEGRQAARQIDLDLMGTSFLPLSGGIPIESKGDGISSDLPDQILSL